MVQKMNQDAIKNIVIFFMAAAYVVGIGYAEIMFIQIVSKMFPTGAAGGFATVGAVVAGVTAICMPVALHWWFSPGMQFAVGVLFYMVDLAMLAANAILSYQMAAGGPIDPFFLKWREFCPATPVFVVMGLALVFSFDISHKLRHQQIAIRALQITRVAQGMEQGMNTQEAQQYLAHIGMQAMWSTAQQLHGQALPQMQYLPTPQSATPLVSLPQGVQALPPAPAKQGWFSRLWNGRQQQIDPATQAAFQQFLQQQASTRVPSEVTGQLVAMPKGDGASPLASPAAFSQNGHMTPPESEWKA